MEEYLAGKTITKVYKGKSGDGQYGPWQAWNFYVEGDERKFGYFSGGKKPEPFAGAYIAMMKFDFDGKYYKVKDLALGKPENNEPRQDPQGGPPNDYEPPGESAKVTKPVVLPKQSGDEKLSFYVSYAKDLAVALIERGEMPEGYTLDDAAKDVMRIGKAMQQQANEVPF